MEKWDKEWDDVLEHDNSGNDFFYEWWSLMGEKSLNDVLEDWGTGEWEIPVRIKMNNKAIFICKR
jgi:hypothetical protein